MHYIIDFDTRSVESKCEDGELLATYILDNNLQSAVALIDSADELILQFSLRELEETYQNLTGNAYSGKDKSEEALADALWDHIDTNKSLWETFTPRLGKRLLKEAAKRQQDGRKSKVGKTATKAKKPASDKPSKPRSSAKNKTLLLGTEPKPNVNLHSIWSCMEDNFGEMKFEELVEAYLFEHDLEEKLVRRYIQKSIRLGHLEIKEDA